MKVLVTGADGFVGKHLTRTLVDAGHTVAEVPGQDAPGGIDVRDAARLLARVTEVCPDAVVHLAGQSSVAQSHDAPGCAFEVNATGTVNLLRAVKEGAPRARVIVVGSGEVYGAVPAGQAAKEDWPLRPLSPYAASKVAAEVAALQFHRSYGLDVVCVRPFNHLGSGQAPHFVVPSLARQLAAIRRGESPPVMKVGDLSAVRDFSHVRDVTAAYVHLLRAGAAGATYNVSSGAGTSIAAVLEQLVTLAAVSVKLEVDLARLRPAELPVLVGDPSALQATGWGPRFGLGAALREVLEEHGVA